MRYHRTELRPQRVDPRTVCDCCGEEYRAPDCYAVEDVTISARIGSVYPEDDCTTITEADCCFKCWTTRIRPAIEAAGLKLRERDADAPSSVEVKQ